MSEPEYSSGMRAADQAQAAMTDFPRGWRRLRSNWAQSWRVGRVEFEIEWVAKARYYTFCLTIHDPDDRT